jgi:hypothetical protein
MVFSDKDRSSSKYCRYPSMYDFQSIRDNLMQGTTSSCIFGIQQLIAL